MVDVLMADGRDSLKISSRAPGGQLSHDGESRSDLIVGRSPTEQLPVGRNRVERISAHGKGLVSDVTSWVELKMKLVQVEIEERIDARVNDMIATAIVAAFGALGGVFLLIALAVGSAAILIAIGLESPLSYFLGFLFIALLLAAGALIMRSMRPHLLNVGKKHRNVETEKLVPRVPSQDQPGS